MPAVPTSDHNEALVGDTLYSAFLNYEWREIVVPYIIAGMAEVASLIEDDTERQAFEVRYGALIDDLYNEDIVDNTPVGTITAFGGFAAPTKWLVCDGASYYKSDYPELWEALANFRLVEVGTGLDIVYTPDLRNRFLNGVTTSNGGSSIGNTGGIAGITLTVGQLPAHNHTVANHAHGLNVIANTAGNNANSVVRGNAAPTATNQSQLVTGGMPNTGSVGDGDIIENRPPYMRLQYIVKALP